MSPPLAAISQPAPMTALAQAAFVTATITAAKAKRARLALAQNHHFHAERREDPGRLPFCTASKCPGQSDANRARTLKSLTTRVIQPGLAPVICPSRPCHPGGMQDWAARHPWQFCGLLWGSGIVVVLLLLVLIEHPVDWAIAVPLALIIP